MQRALRANADEAGRQSNYDKFPKVYFLKDFVVLPSPPQLAIYLYLATFELLEAFMENSIGFPEIAPVRLLEAVY